MNVLITVKIMKLSQMPRIRLYLIVIYGLLFIMPVSAQNLINNAGFETRHQGALPNKPNNHSQINRCAKWKAWGDSPDWYSKVSGFYHGCYDPNGITAAGQCNQTVSLAEITPPDGSNHYAGFGPCEGIQQKLTSKVSRSIVTLDFWWTPRAIENTEINIYLMEGKASTGSVNCSHPSLGGNISIAKIIVSTEGLNPDHIPGTWYHSGYISKEVGSTEFEWILIRGATKGGQLGSPSYIYVDAITLVSEPDCCPDIKLYENTLNLQTNTHVEDYIIAGYDAGIPFTAGNVEVKTGQSVTFKAGNYIKLLPGFKANSGSYFLAKIDACNPTTNSSGGSITMNTFPNVFSSGSGEQLCFSADNATDYAIEVFNRWGISIFNSSNSIFTDPFCIWDGSGDCGSDTYFVVLDLFNCDNSISVAQDVFNFGNPCKASNTGSDTTLLNTQDPTVNKNHISNLLIYPNPSTGLFKVSLPTEKDISITIVDILGNQVFFITSLNCKTHQLDISEHPKGIYFIKVVSGDEIMVKKIVHQ